MGSRGSGVQQVLEDGQEELNKGKKCQGQRGRGGEQVDRGFIEAPSRWYSYYLI